MFSLQSELRACHRYLRYRSCRKGVLFIRKSTSIAQLCCTLFANSVRKQPAATGREARCGVGARSSNKSNKSYGDNIRRISFLLFLTIDSRFTAPPFV